MVPLETDKAPLFPLPKGAILPGELLPLHIFEPRYKAMMQAVRASDQIIAIGTLHPDNVHDAEGRPLISDIVGIGQLLRDEQNADGTSDIVLHGIGRGRITQELPSASWKDTWNSRGVSGALGFTSKVITSTATFPC